ncbi:MAG: GNAT family N-acetyltransferase [Anaerolinea sp.]|nr:GNAT family N-acetyltransferase [Anaerolinea sp.]
MHDADRAHLHLDWFEIEQWLELEPEYVRIALRGSRIVGVLGLSRPLYGASWVRMAAVDSREDAISIITSLWQELLPSLRQHGVRQVAWLMIRDWTETTAAQIGFHYAEQIVTLRRAAVGAPLSSNGRGQSVVRAFQPADLAAITAVDHAAFQPPWQMSRDDLNAASRIAAYATVAIIDGEIVGYQMSTLYFDGAHLARLAVAPSVQGQGIGGALVEDMLHHFHRRGVQVMTVNTQQSNLISQRLYERHGFRRNGYDLPVWICSLEHTLASSISVSPNDPG